jgi:hypothetical protein
MNLTSANSQLAIAVDTIYPVPVYIQGYSTDDAFRSDDVSSAETQMGVDGQLSGGFTPYPVELYIMLQADSPSMPVFDNWLQAQTTTRTLYTANATLTIPGLGQIWTFTKGFLTQSSPLQSGKKILQPRNFKITFEQFSPGPFSNLVI